MALSALTGELGTAIGDWTIGQHYSQILDGKVVVGMSGCYYINTGCWIAAHDPETGEEIWQPTRCRKSGAGGETWGDVPNEEQGGSAWMHRADPELDMIYVGFAVPIPGVKFSGIPAVEMFCGELDCGAQCRHR